MPRCAFLLLAGFWMLLPRCALGTDTGEAFFELKIRPLLVAHCVRCHGADKQSGGLRVDSRSALLAGGDSGRALAPGDPAGSLLVKAVRREGDVQMPPDEMLSAEQVADLTAWIRADALWPDKAPPDAFAAGRHWAFRPREKVTPPIDPTGRLENEIDRFIAARRVDHHLTPTPPAGRRALLRRAYFD
jgi:cytochrome c553